MKVTPIDLSKKTAFTQLYQQSKAQFWLPQTIDLSTDKIQWPTLDARLKNTILSLLKYAIALDSFQIDNVAEFCNKVRDPQLKPLLSYHAMMEGIHTESYSYFAETVCTAEEKELLYSLDSEGEKRLDRLCIIIDKYGHTIGNYWLEAVAFQPLFRLGDILQSLALMPGLGTILSLIARDEELHVKTFELLLTEKHHPKLLEAFKFAAPHEGTDIVKLTGDYRFEGYVKFIAAHRLKGMGHRRPWISSWVENGSPFKELYALGDHSKKKLKGNFFTTSLVYDGARPDLSWEVTEDWFKSR
jgi:ribonucleotide reductase beta subunit family protein with ferritin-like domain